MDGAARFLALSSAFHERYHRYHFTEIWARSWGRLDREEAQGKCRQFVDSRQSVSTVDNPCRQVRVGVGNLGRLARCSSGLGVFASRKARRRARVAS